MKKIIQITIYIICLIAIIAAPIVHFHSLHFLPNVAYYDGNTIIYNNAKYYRIGATTTNSFPKELEVLGEVKPHDFDTMFLYTKAIFAIEGIDKSCVLVIKVPRSFVIISSDPNLSMEDLGL